mgnify:CR=1 FL=1
MELMDSGLFRAGSCRDAGYVWMPGSGWIAVVFIRLPEKTGMTVVLFARVMDYSLRAMLALVTCRNESKTKKFCMLFTLQRAGLRM